MMGLAKTSDKDLNKEQLSAVNHGNGPLLIIAGAGTGKTTVITERIKNLIVTDAARPQEILALTFTERSAREMEERVDIAVPYGYTQMWIATFHAFCDRILRNEALAIGLTTNYRLLTETESIQILKNNLFSLGLNYFRPLGNPNKFIGGMLQHFSRLQDEDTVPSDYIAWARSKFKVKSVKLDKEEKGKYLELANAYQKYQELKTKEGVMDFGDLIGNTLKVFRTRPAILARYRKQFKYVLIDEFQDTNFAQNELAILLAGKEANITAVADDDQSIYRFRGAAVSNVIQFRKHFPKVKIVTLTANYRSTQEILDRSYVVIQNNNPDRLEVKEKIDKKLVAQRKVKSTPVELLYADRVENEADSVARKVQELTAGKKSGENYEYKDFAILVRANTHAEPFTRAFARAGIPYQFLGPGQLFKQSEVIDLISYLKVLDNFENSVCLYRVLSMEHFGISARDIAALLNYSRRFNLSLFEACEQVEKINVHEESKEKITKVVEMIGRHLGQVREKTAGQILFYFLQDSGILETLASVQDTKGERRAQNISKFFEKLKSYEADHTDSSIRAVVDWIDLAQEVGESPAASNFDWDGTDAVNILTVHSSKGLEFPVVFLVNLIAGRFPTYARREQIPIPEEMIKEELPVGDFHIEEERRLFYVGMTRARNRLYLTAAGYYGEGKRERKISPFVPEALTADAVHKSLSTSNEFPNEQLSFFEYSVPGVSPTTQQPDSPLTLNYISYSQIQEFKVCPLHYKLKYILRIPMPQSAAQSFGSTLHKTLADFYIGLANGGRGTVEEMESLYKANWISEGYHSKQHAEEMRKRGQGYLEKYYKNDFDKDKVPLLIEYPFTFWVGDKNGLNLKVGGRIDRVDATDDGIEIIDYKTGKVPTERELRDNLQLDVYALSATELRDPPFGRSPEEITLSLYYFDEGKKITIKRKKEQLEKAKEEILRAVKEISVSDFKCSGSVLCRTCEYKIFCSSAGE